MDFLCKMWSVCLLAFLCMKACEAVKGPRPGNPHHHNHQHQHLCFTQEQLEIVSPELLQPFVGRNMHWERYPAVSLVHKLEENKDRRRRRREPERVCPNLKSSSSSDSVPLNERSISPWSYRIDIDENRYPQKLAFAECLCSGCIKGISGKENLSLNSVQIYQTMLVLRRKPCPHKASAYTFELEYLKVPVGCTCALPKY
ncbi:hypothetical protein FKM82_003790 [Ascaphus truei]|uniref:interleukin-17C n=1 Tax=Ascaphus truei TaxID=8439 RepID=UPI003F5A1D50